MTIVLIETVAGKCLGSRGKKSEEEEKMKRKKNPDKDPKTPDTVQMVERWVDNIYLYLLQKSLLIGRKGGWTYRFILIPKNLIIARKGGWRGTPFFTFVYSYLI